MDQRCHQIGEENIFPPRPQLDQCHPLTQEDTITTLIMIQQIRSLGHAATLFHFTILCHCT